MNAIDLDTNTVTLCDEKRTLNIKLLPKKASRQLRATLVTLQEKCLIHNKQKHKLEAHNDGAIDFVFKMKHKEMLLEMEIREAFLHFMVSILQGYRQFLLPITSAPTVGATDVDNLFDSQVCPKASALSPLPLFVSMNVKFLLDLYSISDWTLRASFLGSVLFNLKGHDNSPLRLDFKELLLFSTLFWCG